LPTKNRQTDVTNLAVVALQGNCLNQATDSHAKLVVWLAAAAVWLVT
jgi:hypothetical protein